MSSRLLRRDASLLKIGSAVDRGCILTRSVLVRCNFIGIDLHITLLRRNELLLANSSRSCTEDRSLLVSRYYRWMKCCCY